MDFLLLPVQETAYLRWEYKYDPDRDRLVFRTKHQPGEVTWIYATLVPVLGYLCLAVGIVILAFSWANTVQELWSGKPDAAARNALGLAFGTGFGLVFLGAGWGIRWLWRPLMRKYENEELTFDFRRRLVTSHRKNYLGQAVKGAEATHPLNGSRLVLSVGVDHNTVAWQPGYGAGRMLWTGPQQEVLPLVKLFGSRGVGPLAVRVPITESANFEQWVQRLKQWLPDTPHTVEQVARAKDRPLVPSPLRRRQSDPWRRALLVLAFPAGFMLFALLWTRLAALSDRKPTQREEVARLLSDVESRTNAWAAYVETVTRWRTGMSRCAATLRTGPESVRQILEHVGPDDREPAAYVVVEPPADLRMSGEGPNALCVHVSQMKLFADASLPAPWDLAHAKSKYESLRRTNETAKAMGPVLWRLAESHLEILANRASYLARLGEYARSREGTLHLPESPIGYSFEGWKRSLDVEWRRRELEQYRYVVVFHDVEYRAPSLVEGIPLPVVEAEGVVERNARIEAEIARSGLVRRGLWRYAATVLRLDDGTLCGAARGWVTTTDNLGYLPMTSREELIHALMEDLAKRGLASACKAFRADGGAGIYVVSGVGYSVL